ncbi:MAG TPA: hypothetical protein VFQ14_05450 [Thermoleophilaceae bacterium]|nr:hypothetical protein [Thermoleophilaceae bacterium]
MDLTPIGVTGPADRRLVAGLHEIRPILDELAPAVLVVGGLMGRLWLHAVPIDMPARPTADIDLGIDRRRLQIAANSRVVGPLLDRLGFRGGYLGEPFRYSKAVDGVGEVLLDIVVPPGTSREEPPLVERGLESVAAPGLAYAVLRGPVTAAVSFVDGEQSFDFHLPIPALEAALVLKAALVESGVRTRLDRVRSDSVDAIMLTAACLKRPDALRALRDHRRRSDVRKSIRWLTDAFRSPTAVGSRRVETHFEEDGYGPGAGRWAADVVSAFAAALEAD